MNSRKNRQRMPAIFRRSSQTTCDRNKLHRRRLLMQNLEARHLLASDFQNPYDPHDVNLDHTASALDALTIINRISRFGSELPEQAPDTGPEKFWDVSGDNRVTAIDALRIINRLGEEQFASTITSLGIAEPESLSLQSIAQSSVTPLGDEFLVNEGATSGYQLTSSGTEAVAANTSGEFVVAYHGTGPGDWAGVFARKYDSAGLPQGEVIRVNEQGFGWQGESTIAMADDGSFVVGWSGFDWGDWWGVSLRRFDSAGNPLTDEISVNETTRGFQSKPAIEILADGSILAAWSGRGDGDSRGVFARRFAADGTPISSEFLVNSFTDGRQENPTIKATADGGFAIAWSGKGAEDTSSVYLQRFGADGTAVGAAMRVNDSTSGNQSNPSIGSSANGELAVVWEGRGDDDESGVYLQRLSADGTPIGSQRLVNTTTYQKQKQPSLSMRYDGSAVVTWSSYKQDGSGWGIIGQEFDAAGHKLGDEFIVNTTTRYSQRASTVAAFDDGFAVAWNGRGNGDRQGIFARTYRKTSGGDTTPPILNVGLANDTGTSDSDGVTFDARLTGTVTDNVGVTSLTASIDGASATPVTYNADTGTFSFDPGSLTDGSHTVTFVAEDAAGNAAAADVTFTLDTTAPAPPTDVRLTAATDTGVSDSDGITMETSPTVQGNAEIGSTVELFVDGSPVGESISSGTWQISTGSLSEGSHMLTAAATDAAGNTSNASPDYNAEIDISAETITQLDLAPAFDSAPVGDQTTTFTFVTLVGQTTANTSVELLETGQTTTSDGTGQFQFASVSLAPGVSFFTARSSDLAGNQSDLSTTITRVNADEDPPTISAALVNDTGSSATDGITSDPRINGIVADALSGVASLTVTVDDGSPMAVPFDAITGEFTFDPGLALDGSDDGSHVVSFTAIDQAGNANDPLEISFELDTIAPAPPTGVRLTAATDTGISDSDGITMERSPIVRGEAEIDSLIELFVDGDSVGQATADGAWQLATGTLAEGPHTLKVSATDFAGNTSGDSELSEIEVDLTAPPITNFVLDPAFDTDPVGDMQTRLPVVTLVGEALPDQQLNLLEPSITTTADNAGVFAFTGLLLQPGANLFQVTATDLAGNQTLVSASVTSPVTSGSNELQEAGQFSIEQSQLVDLGQAEGTRSLQFELNAAFDRSDSGVSLEDAFLVYLVDPADRSQTLLDNGTPGTALFTLQGDRAEFMPGQVTFDGNTVAIDLSTLANETEGLLLFQLLNNDLDNGSRVTIGPLSNEVDPNGESLPKLVENRFRAPIGGSLDLFQLNETTDVAVELRYPSFNSETGRFTAELQIVNNGPDLGSSIAVRFPGLPSGVAIANASGDDPNGVPYISMQQAVGSGGIRSGESSAAVLIEIDNPSATRFQLQPQVLVGGPNRAPELAPVADVTVMPGGFISVPLIATDPDGDRISFAIQSEDDLPSVTLLPNGVLEIAPQPGNEASYPVTVVASDGALEATRQFTINVTPDPVTTTRISGQVLDVDGTPLPGVPISLSRLTVFTDSDGRFLIELPSHLLPTEEFDIPVPIGDVVFDPFNTGEVTIDMRRARFDTSTGTDPANPRRHPNLVSSFLDASVVYGSDQVRADALRTLDGTGKLKTSPGDLLPFNSTDYFPDGPLENDSAGQADPTSLFVAGDIRSSENPALSSLHILLLREHNRLADEVSTADPSLTGVEIYHRARRLMIGKLQHITYNEYLPLLLGADAIAPYTGYDSSLQPGIGSFFTTVAFRIGHSQANSDTERLDANGSPLAPISTLEGFFNTSFITDDGIDPILRGITSQVSEEIDTQVVSALRNTLFGPPGAGGLDLPAMSIQRARDLGLPSYNQARVDLGLSPVTSFEEITPDTQVQNQLAATYQTVDQIDAFVGGLAEPHVTGALVGELFFTALKQQFERTRDSDRFWYENGQFTADELSEIRATSLSSLVQQNTDVSNLPTNLFTALSAPSGPVPAGTTATAIPTETRQIDGFGNNTANPDWGSTDSNLLIDTSLNYADGISAPNGADRPNARVVSNGVLDQTVSTASSAGATAMFVFWGQLLAHDLSQTPTGTSDALLIHADEANIGNLKYPFLAEKLGELLGHETYEGQNNVISRPIYLPALDMTLAVPIDPATDTMVTTEAIPGLELMVKGGNLMDDDGNLYDGDLVIAEVPFEFTPVALPENLQPDTVITIQPAGFVFDEPAPVSFPNLNGFPAGTPMDLWAINHETGQFEIVGEMEVSADGISVDTVSGGLRATSWAFPASPPAQPLPPQDDSAEKDDKCPACETGVEIASEVLLHSGQLLENHDLVSYSSLGQTRGLSLQYDSLRADPRPILNTGIIGTAPFGIEGTYLEVSPSFLAHGVFHRSGNGYERRLEQPTDLSYSTFSGSLGSTGADTYTFTATQGQRFAIRSLRDSNQVRVKLASPNGEEIFDVPNFVIRRSPSDIGIRRPFVIEFPETGEYTLTVSRSFSSGPGIYRLDLRDVSDYGLFTGDHLFEIDQRFTDGYRASVQMDLTEIRSGNFIATVGTKLSTYDGAAFRGTGFDIAPRREITHVNAIDSPFGSGWDLAGLQRIVDDQATLGDDGSRRSAVLLVDGDGQELVFAKPDFGARPVAVALGDLDNDGNLDIVTANSVTDDVAVFLGDGLGGIEDLSNTPVGDFPRALSLGDMNNDGNLDVVVANDLDDSITVLLGNGLGRFGDRIDLQVGPAPDSISLGDFDGDGNLDIVTNGSRFGLEPITVVFGDGLGGSKSRTTLQRPDLDAVSIVDIDNDGNLDIVGTGFRGVYAFLGDGTGGFSERTQIVEGNISSLDELAMGDINGDGDVDLVSRARDSLDILVWIADGAGSFSIPQVVPQTDALGNFYRQLTDVNGDGHLDLITSVGFVFTGDGLGGFTKQPNLGIAGAIDVGDLDGDGRPDFVTTNSQATSISVLLGDGEGGGVGRKDFSTAGPGYVSPPGDFSTLEKQSDGTFRRTFKDGMVHDFNQDDLLETVTDRNGNVTTYLYDSELRPIGMIDPVGLRTDFFYDGGQRVARIVDPTGRTTRLEHDDQGNLIRITDPDGTSRSFSYDGEHRMTGEIDQRGFAETVEYGFHGRVTSATRKDGSRLQVNPLQTRILYPSSLSSDPLNAPPAVPLTLSPVAQTTDGNGNVTETTLDRAGQAVSQIDGVGRLSTIDRDDSNLVSEFIDGRGHSTQFTYDSRGNRTSSRETVDVQVAVTGPQFPSRVFSLPGGVSDIATADFDGDGDFDIVTGHLNEVSVLLNNGDGSFSRAADYFTLGSSLDIGDVNGDGSPDVVAGDGGSVSVLISNGLGGLLDSVEYSASAQFADVNDVGLADFNGDSIQDIVTVQRASISSNVVSILLGNGNGTFQTAVNYSGGPLTSGFDALALGDLDADGNVDVIAASKGGTNISLLRGQGDGTLAEALDLPVTDRPVSIAVADVNNDSADDLVITLEDNSVRFLQGNNDGTFSVPQLIGVAVDPSTVAVGDTNGDLTLDIVTANEIGDTASVFIGNGDGTFMPGVDYVAGAGPVGVVLEDFDGDDSKDLVIANRNSQDLSVLSGNGDGTFENPFAGVRLPTGKQPKSVVTGDLDGDGNPDLVSFGIEDSGFTINTDDDVISIFRGDGLGGFSVIPDQLASVNPTSVALGDLDNDGDLDVVTANEERRYCSQFGMFGCESFANEGTNSVNVHLSNGDGTFTTGGEFAVSNSPESLTLKDLDGDGSLDAITVTGGVVTVLLGIGDGSFNAAAGYGPGSQSDFTIDDVDGDTNLDIVALGAGANGAVTTLLGNGDGSFRSANAASLGQIESLASGDVDADGDTDIVLGNVSNDTLLVVLSNGDGTFGATIELDVPGNFVDFNRNSVKLRDVDGDGTDDIVAALGGGRDQVAVFLSSSDATFASPLTFAAVSPGAIAIDDIDADGALDLIATSDEFNSNTISLLPGNGDGSFEPSVEFDVGFRPDAIAIADLNGDGNSDVVTANAGDDTVSILLGAGDGTFSVPIDFGVGDSPNGIAVGDVDLNGTLDIVTSNAGDSSFSLLTGTGDGTFLPGVSIDAGASSQDVAIGDINGDGFTDISGAGSNDLLVLFGNGDGTFNNVTEVSIGFGLDALQLVDMDGSGELDFVSVQSFRSVSIYLGNGDGTFVSPSVPIGTSPESIASGDVDGNSVVDIIIANSADRSVSLALGNGDGTFADAIEFAVGDSPMVVDLRDIDGDTGVDVVTANNDGSVSVLANDGSGSFAAMKNFLAGDGTRSLAFSDLDSDGDVDISTANEFSQSLSVLFNNGDGTFPNPRPAVTATGDLPEALATGDINNDGFDDIITANSGEDSVSVLLGDGVGGFAEITRLETGRDPQSLALGFIDGDLHLDVVVANESDDSVTLFFGDGTGGFTSGISYRVGRIPTDVALRDVDGDGRTDIVTANSGEATVSILKGDDDRRFPGRGFESSRRISAAAVADVDGDGNPDIISADPNDDTVSVQLSDGVGGFGDPTAFGVGNFPQDVLAIDINADSSIDLIAVNRFGDSVSVLLGNGNGSFSPSVDYAAGDGARGVAVTDVNNDGNVDIITANENADSFSVLLGNGDGSFLAPIDQATEDGPHDVVLVDLNNDGLPDAVTANANADRISVHLGNGDGTFGAGAALSVGDSPVAVDLGDLNGDGVLDLSTANRNSDDISVLLGVGDGTFSAAANYPSANGAQNLTVRDVNDDGFLDVVSVDNLADSFSVLLGDGTGTLSSPISYAVSDSPLDVTFVDVDGDNNIDALVTHQWKGFLLLDGNDDGTFSNRVDVSVGLEPRSVVVEDIDRDGNLDITTANAFSDTVSVLFGDGSGLFSAQTEIGVGNRPWAVKVGDVDLNGNLDIVTSNLWDNTVSVALGNGDRMFEVTETYAVGDFPGKFVLEDVDGDGRLDIVTANGPDTVSLLLGSDDGFAQAGDFAVGGDPSDVGLIDVNNDGNLDIITTNSLDNSLSILLNEGLADRDTVVNVPKTLVTEFSYDPAFSQLTRIVDELDRRTLFEVDPANGNTLSVTQVVGDVDASSSETDDLVTQFTYTAQGLIDTITDPLGRVTDNDYDAFGRLQQVTYAVGTVDEASQSLEYDTAGNVSALIDENGNRTEFTYDLMNRVTQITEADPDGPGGPLTSPTTILRYDEVGNLIETTDARNNTSSSSYDPLSRLVQQRDADGNLTQLVYDRAGNLISVIDPLGHLTHNEYDGRNRLTATIDPDDGRTSFTYDANNNLTSVTDPVGNQTSFAYDVRNRVRRETDPRGSDITYSYDAVDNLIARNDRNGRTIELAYDPLDRLVTETWLNVDGSDANQIDYAYDKASNLTSIADAFSSLQFAFDNRERIQTVDNTGTPGVPNVVLDYGFDDVGNVTSVADTIDAISGATTTYQYDGLNRTIQVAQSGTSVSEKRVNFSYNPLGQFESIARFSDLAGTQQVVTTNYTYDVLNRLEDLRHNNGSADVAFYEFAYDAASRITSINDIDGLTTYTYDDRDQLTGADRDAADSRGDESYTYDANGNRIDSHLHDSGYVTDTANRLISDGTYDYAYDDEGNMTLRTEIATGDYRTFEWDHRNRLVAVSDFAADDLPTQRVEFTYDAFDRRISKSVETDPTDAVDAAVTHFVYDREDVILDLVDADGAGSSDPVLDKRYLHGPAIDQVLAQEDGSGDMQWLLTDHLGSTRDLVDNTGVVVNHIAYDSFGNVLSQSSLTVGTRYLYTGREYDSETELFYYRARHYDAGLGRFVGEDPIGFTGLDANLYRYVINNPLSYIDPFGLQGTNDLIHRPTSLSELTGGGIEIEADVGVDVRVGGKQKAGKANAGGSLSTSGDSASISISPKGTSGPYAQVGVNKDGVNASLGIEAGLPGVKARSGLFGDTSGRIGVESQLNIAIRPVNITAKGKANLKINDAKSGIAKLLDTLDKVLIKCLTGGDPR